MTLHVPEDGSAWLANWILVSNSLPPRNPNDNDAGEEEAEEDEEDEDQDGEVPAIKEPDE